MDVTGNAGFSSSRHDLNSLRSSQYDLFDSPRYSKDVLQHDERVFYPARMDDDDGPFEILITGNGTQFLQMEKALWKFGWKLLLKMQIQVRSESYMIRMMFLVSHCQLRHCLKMCELR